MPCPPQQQGFLGGSAVKNPSADEGDGVSIPRSGRRPWRRKWQPTVVVLPGESHGQRSLVGYSPWVCKKSNTIKHTYTLFKVCKAEVNSAQCVWLSFFKKYYQLQKLT